MALPVLTGTRSGLTLLTTNAMTTLSEIEILLSQQMHGTWEHLDHLSRTACELSYALGDRKGYEQGYNAGYEAGFQVASTAERGIVSLQTRFDQVDNSTVKPAPVPPKDLAHSAGDGSVHPVFADILKSIAP